MIVLDANMLLRLVSPNHPQYPEAFDAVSAFVGAGWPVCIVPQAIYEFWVVATRPADVNGLGITTEVAADEVDRFEQEFRLLADTPSIYQAWRDLVIAHSIGGKPAHDARIVAAMRLHDASHLLTFNVTDFKRFDGVTVVHPRDAKQFAKRASNGAS